MGTSDKTGEPQYAAAHDFRRAFGDRWSKRVMPAVLKQLMRHSSIHTTVAYYITGDAQETADLLYESLSGSTSGNSGRSGKKTRTKRKTEAIDNQ